MAAKLVSEMLLNSWHKAHFELPLSAKKNILLHTVALEEAYEDFFDLQGEIPLNQKIFNEYVTTQSWFAKFLSNIGSYQPAIIISQRVTANQMKFWDPSMHTR